MKVCRIIPALDFGGVEQRIKLTALGFKDHPEIQLQIVVLGKGGRISKELEGLGFEIHILGENFRIPNVGLFFRLIDFLKNHKPDVVHTSGSEANFHGLLAAKIARIPVRIGEEIGFPNHGKLWKMIFNLTYRTSHVVIGISKAVADQLISLGEIPSYKAIVIYNPVALPEYSEIPSFTELNKEDKFVFVVTCRLVPIKNIALLLREFSELINEIKNTKIMLWIIGSGPEQNNLEKLSKILEIEKYIHFFGFQKDVFPFLKQADAFVLPSLSEGFSISLVEAMLMGLPTIATKVGGPSEIIEDGKSGFLIDPGDKGDLKSRMKTTLSMNSIERNKMKENAVKRGQFFSLNSYVGNLTKLYTGLINDK
ncbi:glycosyltransferase [Cognataquiflexum aquatile]|uniref:glycosyltransferase n=1 Tax=Cognataquiflexum aquatile TaxID=2249427 RepID=UPI000DEB40DE|nr:glycosyltransferase [Cognataquiflexum aquatile]